jgi:hypothetical protein
MILFDGASRQKVSQPSPSSDGKTLPAATSTRRIGVIEVKALALQSTRKLQRRVAQIKEALQIADHRLPVVIEDLIAGLYLIVKIHVVGQAGAAPAGDRYANEIVIAQLILGAYVLNSLLGTFCNK